MSTVRTVGFLRMHKEAGEKRVFLPEFIGAVAGLGAHVLLEKGYGSEIDLDAEDYSAAAAPARDGGSVTFTEAPAAGRADLVIVLRSPERDEFARLVPGTCLLSMLHFPTRSWRVQALLERGVDAIAMDQVIDDDGRRLVENLSAVAWNGLETAFDVLGRLLPGFARADGEPVRVVVLGSGAVGRHAVDAAVKYGSLTRRAELMSGGHPGIVCTTLGRPVSGNAEAMRAELSRADILVDATQRSDASQPVVPNEWISWLPKHAVIADLCVDPYLAHDTPPVVRAIEGIPRGDLDHYVFAPDDPGWCRTIPDSIMTEHRRHVVSCYSWPGIRPRECMEHYGRQLLPVVESLVRIGYAGLSANGDAITRAVYRGSLRAFVQGSTPRDRISRTASEGTGGDE